MSCGRAREALDAKKADVAETRMAKKAPLTDAEARKLLASVDTVVIAKRKDVRELAAKDATLDDLRGPTGGFRAPMLRMGRTLVVGFSPEVFAKTMS